MISSHLLLGSEKVDKWQRHATRGKEGEKTSKNMGGESGEKCYVLKNGCEVTKIHDY